MPEASWTSMRKLLIVASLLPVYALANVALGWVSEIDLPGGTVAGGGVWAVFVFLVAIERIRDPVLLVAVPIITLAVSNTFHRWVLSGRPSSDIAAGLAIAFVVYTLGGYALLRRLGHSVWRWLWLPPLVAALLVLGLPIAVLWAVENLWAGLVVAFVLCTLAGYLMLRVLEYSRSYWWAPPAIAAAFVIGLPIAVLVEGHARATFVTFVGACAATGVLVGLRALGRPKRWLRVSATAAVIAALIATVDALKVPVDDRTASTRLAFPRTVDLVIVSPKRAVVRPAATRTAPPKPVDVTSWKTFYTVMLAGRGLLGFEIRPVLEGSTSRDQAVAALIGQTERLGTAPTLLDRLPRENRVIVLNVDGVTSLNRDASLTDPDPERAPQPEDWSDAVETLNLSRVPVVALLAGNDQSRLAEWRSWTKRWSQPSKGAAFHFSEVSDLGTTSVVDAALRVATQTSETFGDAALAAEYRPRLRFALGEKYAFPVNVGTLFRTGAVRACPAIGGGLIGCDKIEQISGLTEEYDFLDIDIEAALEHNAAYERESRYYWHVVHDKRERLSYVGYWWYLPYNPSPVLSASFCTPGFSIRDLTCFDHESDWEGVTVVVRDGERTPTEVRYAQHRKVVRYGWSELVRLWEGVEGGGFKVGVRPLVYVAKGSHASYPHPCKAHCLQGARLLFEGRNDGSVRWAKNDDPCGACLEPLPTDIRGNPALWNGFDGEWGAKHCVLRDVICNVGNAPRAPSKQDQYKTPATQKVDDGDAALKDIRRVLEG
jgi:hypothetical protein